MHDWNAIALFAVIGTGMLTSAALLVRTVLTSLRASDTAA